MHSISIFRMLLCRVYLYLIFISIHIYIFISVLRISIFIVRISIFGSPVIICYLIIYLRRRIKDTSHHRNKLNYYQRNLLYPACKLFFFVERVEAWTTRRGVYIYKYIYVYICSREIYQVFM